MVLEKLSLANFRNHSKFQLEAAPLNILVGPNGVGKTNILEAIEMISTSRSHRTSQERDLVQSGQNFARLIAQTSLDEPEEIILNLSLLGESLTKNYQINGVNKKAADILGRLPTVVFSPQTLDLVYGSPGQRRRFLDAVLSQTDHHYLHSLWQYNRVIKERNKLLARIDQNLSQAEELKFWNTQLVKHGQVIIKSRANFVEFLKGKISTLYKEISASHVQVMINYQPRVDADLFDSVLEKNCQQEIYQGITLYGPHRDDLRFVIEDSLLSTHGSRGECRSFILSLKIAELDYYRQQTGNAPLLLLDDVFSELDLNRRHLLSQMLALHQTIITTTDLDHIDPAILSQAQIIKLEEKNG